MGKSIFELQKIIQIPAGRYGNGSDARKSSETQKCAHCFFVIINTDIYNSLQCLQYLKASFRKQVLLYHIIPRL